ncbi:hypothetical protein V8C37DRAFT_386520 [Trichoderma ceciliae]
MKPCTAQAKVGTLSCLFRLLRCLPCKYSYANSSLTHPPAFSIISLHKRGFKKKKKEGRFAFRTPGFAPGYLPWEGSRLTTTPRPSWKKLLLL